MYLTSQIGPTNTRMGTILQRIKLNYLAINSSVIQPQTNSSHTIYNEQYYNVPDSPLGENILKWIGTVEIAFERPVSRSVSSEISFLTAATYKLPIKLASKVE